MHALLAAAFALMTLASALPALATDAGPAIPEPPTYRLDNYRTPVPQTLAGARAVLTADVAKALKDTGQAVFIDVYPRAPKPANLPASTVWREPPHRSIADATWLPNVGYGVLAPETQAYFDDRLARLSPAGKATPLVFFCLRDCWMSWNAAKRALEMGYTAVYWFPEGTDAWEEQGYPLAVIPPMP